MKKNVNVPDLNKLSKETIIELYTQLQLSYATLLQQNTALVEKVDSLTDQVKLLNQRLYGRKSEKNKDIPGQIEIDFDTLGFVINEPEVILDHEGEAQEPTVEEATAPAKKQRKKKSSGAKARILADIRTEREDITLPDSKLDQLFPKGYKELPSEKYKVLERIPAQWVAHEKVIHIYASRDNDGCIVRAEHPQELMNNCIVTPSLAGAIMNAKFVLGLPLNRVSQEYYRQGVDISRQVMARWMIRLSETYLEPVYEAMHRELLKAKLIHADETPTRVAEECKERGSSANAFMWLYYTGPAYGSPTILIYDYETGRDVEKPKAFLDGYHGMLVTDGYQVYHLLENISSNDIRVCGCWIHARRKYADLIKANSKKYAGNTVAGVGYQYINMIYQMEHLCDKEASPADRLQNRKQNVKPVVDAYFAWAKECLPKTSPNSEIYKALNYSINQEGFLRRFLDDPMIPLDNNAAERGVRKYCVEKHTWHVIGSNRGARASAVIISIMQTAISNGLNGYEFMKYLLTEIMDRQYKDYAHYTVDDLLPWSPSIPESCRMKKQNRTND